jgi:dienelactone hydrolase
LIKIILLLVLLQTTQAYAGDNLIKINTRDGVKQKFILLKPDTIKASVILFAGGKGKIKLKGKEDNYRYKSNNFLVRSRELFAHNNLMVAVVDAPSDKYDSNGMWYGFRASKEHIQDIETVIDYLKQQANVPIWLIGTSRGTESVAHIAIHSNKVDGLVLTASLSRPQRKGTEVTAMELDKITVPTLVVSHKKDECFVTPPEDTNKIVSMLLNSKNVKSKLFDGGNMPISKPCKSRSYHGFLGIEKEVVDYISRFIAIN